MRAASCVNASTRKKETSVLVYIPEDFYKLLYGEAPPERGTFFMLHVYERSGISRLEVCEGMRKSVI